MEKTDRHKDEYTERQLDKKTKDRKTNGKKSKTRTEGKRDPQSRVLLLEHCLRMIYFSRRERLSNNFCWNIIMTKYFGSFSYETMGWTEKLKHVDKEIMLKIVELIFM